MKMFNKKNDAGVSPVIATLVLVLVAVAAGVAFFAWQSNWQDDTTSNIGDGVVKTEIEIGGSSTVLPFTAVAAEAYMEANPTVQINYQSGGSGAGTAGVAAGTVDIGAASSSRDASDFPNNPNMVIERVGQDAVGLVVDTTNTRVTDMSQEWALMIYDGTITTWGEVPMHSGYDYTATDAAAADTTITVVAGDYMVWSLSDFSDRQYYSSVATTLTVPQADFTDGETLYAVEVADITDTATINKYDRTDKSGTEECFSKKLLGLSSSSIDESWATGVLGNQEMLDHFASGDYADDIGFISTGIATSDVILLTLNGVEATNENIADGSYVANRPLLYMYDPTICANVDIVEDYIQFCLQPMNNEEFCEEVDFISWYDLA